MHPLRPILLLPLALMAAPLGAVDYQNDIQAILKEHCWECHSNEKEVKGGLAFDDIADLSRSAINPVGLIRPGDPEKSDFVARLKLDEEEDDFMPKNGKPLRGGDLSKIEQWIREGALIDAANPTPAAAAASPHSQAVQRAGENSPTPSRMAAAVQAATEAAPTSPKVSRRMSRVVTSGASASGQGSW